MIFETLLPILFTVIELTGATQDYPSVAAHEVSHSNFYLLYTVQYGQVQLRDDTIKLPSVLYPIMNVRYRNIFTN